MSQAPPSRAGSTGAPAIPARALTLPGLATGPHTFSVRATDAAGNAGADATVTWTYVPDTTPPTLRIASAPPASTSDTRATITFSADEGGATFRCSLDGGAEAACTSPVSYASLGVGSHLFAVRATDRAGNTSAPASHQWTIFELLPDLYVGAFGKSMITVSNRGNGTAGPSTLTITLVGTFTVPSLGPGASALLVVDLPRRHLLGDRRPHGRGAGVGRRQQHRESSQQLPLSRGEGAWTPCGTAARGPLTHRSCATSV